MKELPYFKMDPGEFLGDDIAVASNTAIGIFTRFLMKAWMSDGYLKNDDLLQRKLNVCSTDDEQALKFLLDHRIIKQKDDRLYVKFQVLQIEEYMNGLVQKSQAGKASARKRAAKILNNISLKKSTVVERSLDSRCNETSTGTSSAVQRKSTNKIEKEKESKIEIYKDRESINPPPLNSVDMYNPQINEPTRKLVKDYAETLCVELSDAEADKFINHHAKFKWIVGNTPIRDIRPALKSWILKIPEFAGMKGKAEDHKPMVFGGKVVK